MIFVQVSVPKSNFRLACAKKIYIRYFVLKIEVNNYLGGLEVTQDVTEVQSLRLLDLNINDIGL